jgi:putative peptidoglycan lipid II flippase
VRLRVAPWDPDLLRYLAVAAPLVLGLSLLAVDEWYERWFGSRVGEGVVAQLGYARQLMLAPVAVVGQAVATAALPTLARLFSQGRHAELARTTLRTLQGSLGLGILAAAGVYVLAPRLVEVLFQRGAFGADDTQAVARLLRVLCFAVPAWVVQQVAARGFYARGDTWRPMLLGTGLALGALPLYLGLGERFGAAGLAAAGALAMSANAVATLLWARVRHGAPELGALAATGARALVAALPAAALGLVVQRGAPGLGGALTDLALGGACFGAAAALAGWWIADEALRAPLRRLGRRVARRAAPDDPAR